MARKPRKGAAAKAAEEKDGEARHATGGNNPYNDPFTEECIARHEELDKDIASIMSKAMLDCKEIRGEQRELLDQAKERGMNKGALRAHLKERALLRKAEAIREKLDEPIQNELDLLKQYLGVLADLPLGQAAIASSGLAGAEAAGSA